MKKLLLAGAMLVALPFAPAKADIIFDGIVDFTGLGFGAFPRLITMQEPTSGPATETGTVTPDAAGNPVVSGDAIANAGGNKSNTPTIGSLGWDTGALVKLAFDLSQTGASPGLTLNTMGINLYNGTALVGTFQLPAGGFDITPALASGLGNGNNELQFSLNAAEQAQFNALVLADGTNLRVGSFGSWGAPGPNVANDGPDSLLAVPAAVPGPIAGAGIPGLIGMCLGMVALARRRINRIRGILPAVMH